METMTESKHTPEKQMDAKGLLRLVADVNLKMAIQDDAAYGANIHATIYQWLEDNKEDATAAERDKLKEINKELVEFVNDIRMFLESQGVEKYWLDKTDAVLSKAKQ